MRSGFNWNVRKVAHLIAKDSTTFNESIPLCEYCSSNIELNLTGDRS